MLLSLYQVVLPVSDIDQAEKFYSHLLGTPGRRVSPGRHHYECGQVILNCYDPSAEGDSSQTSSSPHRLYFVVEDIEAVFERARSGGCASMDEQILSQPWGDRSFSAEDPFKNSLGFVDETAAIQRAGEQSAAGPDDCLKTGCALSIRSIAGASNGQLAAAVTKIFREEVWLKLAEPPLPTSSREKRSGFNLGMGKRSSSLKLKSSRIVLRRLNMWRSPYPRSHRPLKREPFPGFSRRSRSPFPSSVLPKTSLFQLRRLIPRHMISARRD